MGQGRGAKRKGRTTMVRPLLRLRHEIAPFIGVRSVAIGAQCSGFVAYQSPGGRWGRGKKRPIAAVFWPYLRRICGIDPAGEGEKVFEIALKGAGDKWVVHAQVLSYFYNSKFCPYLKY